MYILESDSKPFFCVEISTVSFVSLPKLLYIVFDQEIRSVAFAALIYRKLRHPQALCTPGQLLMCNIGILSSAE